MDKFTNISKDAKIGKNLRIDSFSTIHENVTIGDTWIPITKFFSPFETENGKQIVVDRTIDGAIEMAKALGIEAHKTSDTSVEFLKLPLPLSDTHSEFLDALRKMRMFSVKQRPPRILISY